MKNHTKIPERDIQKLIMDYLNLKHIEFVRNQTGALKTEENRYIKFGKKGSADLIVCYPVKGIGIYVEIEVKAEKGRQSPAQVEHEQDILKGKGFYFVVRSLEELVISLKQVEMDVLNKMIAGLL